MCKKTMYDWELEFNVFQAAVRMEHDMTAAYWEVWNRFDWIANRQRKMDAARLKWAIEEAIKEIEAAHNPILMMVGTSKNCGDGRIIKPSSILTTTTPDTGLTGRARSQFPKKES